MNAREDQEIAGKAYDVELARRLWRFIRPHRKVFFLSVLLLPVHQCFNLAQPLLLKAGIDAVGDGDGFTLITTGILFFAALLAEGAAFFFQYYLAILVAQRCLADLRVELFSHVQRLPMSYFDRNPVGRLMTRMTTDVEVLQEMFAAGAMNLVADLVLIAAIVAIMLSLHVGLALVSVAMIPLLLLAINVFRVKARQTYRLIRTRIARVNAYLGEAIPGMAVIQLFNRQARSFEEFDDLNRAHRDAIQRSNLYEASLFSIVEAAGSLTIALLLWYGGGEVLQGIVSIGTFVAFSEYIRRLFVPLRDFSNKYAVIQAAMTAAERIFDLLDTPPEAPGRAVSPATTRPAAPPAAAPAVVPAVVKPSRGAVEFDDVWFSYRPNDPVLKGVSFKIEPGERVAVIGATGSGKTTTIKLMSRFYDVDSGVVRVGAGTSGSGTRTPCGATWGWCFRTCSCSRETSFRTSNWVTDRFRRTGFVRRCATPTRRVSSGVSPAGCGPPCASGEATCRRGSGSSWRWCGCSSSIRRYWCWTRLPPASTPRPSSWCRGPSRRSWPTAPVWSSPIAFPPSGTPTASSYSTGARYARWARTPS